MNRGRHPGTPFQRFVEAEVLGGLLLLLGAAAALAVANSPLSVAYERFWATELTLGVRSHGLSLTFREWVSDGLMAVFFVYVGLEIKREFIAGELSSPRQAVLPVAAAIGGMLLPAVVYLAFNHGGSQARGWGIPMATDIAFALGSLALVASSIPVGAKIFLTALAIVDDMGAVVVIALFYSGGVSWPALVPVGAILGALIILNRSNVGWLSPYLVLGMLLWPAMRLAGIHSTVAGVLLALAIPATSKINAAEFSESARALLDEFDATETGDLLVLTSKGQQNALGALAAASEAVTAPLLRLEHALHRFCAFAIMPVFAFANAGVRLNIGALHWRVMLGVALGLAVGKPIGITAGAMAAVAGKLAVLPDRVGMRALHGCGWLGGIGFTMSLFIADLAFRGTPFLDSAKIGILTGSLVSAAVGAAVLKLRVES